VEWSWSSLSLHSDLSLVDDTLIKFMTDGVLLKEVEKVLGFKGHVTV
jgi:hypothetical protein